MYRSLSPVKTVETIRLLNKRIEERFPKSNLSHVCEVLSGIADEAKSKSVWIARPNIPLRVGIALVILFGFSLVMYSVSLLDIAWGQLGISEFMQAVDASMQTIFFTGVVIFFLVTAEVRLKRSRALEAIHELRVIAHVIDMHQLTKDPSRVMSRQSKTASSPGSDMTPFELIRYLDYCTEMLSLTGKVASLYAQNFRDTVVMAAVTEVENLTTGLAEKIWHKIVILHSYDENKTALAMQTLRPMG
ncbi:MAG: hypothetical protein JXA04_04230 [Gammaproteobacteria bacterium]|nr:hypothetical protein [Gammaproteobacteria bacterium]